MSGPRSSFQSRVDWMVMHPEVWRNWPTTPDRFIIQRLQEAGLVSNTRSNKYMDLSKLIGEARSQMKRKPDAK